MSITVVLADDHAMFRQSLTGYLAGTPDVRVVAAVATAEEAVEAVELDVQHRPHDLRRARAVAGEGAEVLLAARPVEGAAVNHAEGPSGDGVVVRHHGAALAGAWKVARDFPGRTLVTILPDRGERYLSTSLFRSYCGKCPP